LPALHPALMLSIAVPGLRRGDAWKRRCGPALNAWPTKEIAMGKLGDRMIEDPRDCARGTCIAYVGSARVRSVHRRRPEEMAEFEVRQS
jgi:hypothetical protein